MSAAPLVTPCADADAAGERAAQAIAARLRDALAQRGVAHLALAGGSVATVYERLGPLVDDWGGVHLWYGDERVVPHDSPDSNHGLALAHLRAPGATWHPVPTELGADAAAAAYARALAGVVLDVALNGIGPDGHTASLFPGFPQLEATAACVAVHDAPKPPPERVTLTLPTLAAAGRIVLLATGPAKAPALARVLAGPDRALPASLLARDRLEVVADRAALGTDDA